MYFYSRFLFLCLSCARPAVSFVNMLCAVRLQVDYEGVMKAKLHIARTIYDRLGATTVASEPYKEWLAANGE